MILKGAAMKNLVIDIESSEKSHATWRYLMQSPSEVTADIGDTMLHFLTKRLEFDENYIDSQIKTIFIDGKPVDDLTTAKIPENARIALGAVAPGVAGMTMCRNSPISSMRSGITFHNEQTDQHITEGTVTLLLFNAVMEDKGLQVLQKGIAIPASKLESAITQTAEEIRSASLNDEKITSEELLEWVRKNPQSQVQLRVNSAS